MAYLFNGSDQYLQYSGTLGLAGYPITVSGWINKSTSAFSSMAGFFDLNGNARYYWISQGDETAQLYQNNDLGSSSDARTTTSHSLNNWHHICGATTSAEASVWLDGGNKVTDIASVSWNPSTDVFSVGARRTVSPPSGWFPGKIAEIGVWNAVLTDEEVASLAAGYSPLFIRPQNLIAYWPLIANTQDKVGGFGLTAVNTPTPANDHPSIIYPTTPYIVQNIQASPAPVSISLDIVTDLSVSSYTESDTRDRGIIFDSILTTKTPGWDLPPDGHDPRHNTKQPFLPKDMLSEGTESTEELVHIPNKSESGEHYHQPLHYWYEHTHLLPRTTQDLGNVISAQTIDVDLYNADRYNSITITSVDNNLGEGIEITGFPTAPFVLESQTGTTGVMTVNTDGDFSIDGSYTFHTSDGNSFTITVIGTRIILLPIRPEAPLREHLEFNTKILTAEDGTEQRIANRKAPRSLFEMTIKASDHQRSMVDFALFDRQSKVIAVPAWHEPSFLSSAASVDDTTINVNTTNYANFYVGGYAVILRDEFTYDALEIESMTATSLTFTSGISFAYDENTQVMPMLLGYANANIGVSRNLNNVETYNIRLKVDVTDNNIADASSWSTYNGKVLLDSPNMVDGGQLSEALERKILVLDNLTGVFDEYSKWDRNKRSTIKGFKTNSREELWHLRQLLHYLKGQQVSFYLPTFAKEIVPSSVLLGTSSTLNMHNVGYTKNVRTRDPKKYIRVFLTDGTQLNRTIVTSQEISNEVEQLTVDSAWPYDIQIEDIDRIDFLEKVRISVDDIVITHYNALGQAKSFVPVKEVFD